MCQPKLFKLNAQSNSLCLQMMLHFNVYFSTFWALIYAYNIFCSLHIVWTVEGSFILLTFLVALTTESGRVYYGMRANLRMQRATLIVFLTLTPFIMLPILLFLRFLITTQITLITYATEILLVLMAFELPAGIFTYLKFLREQTQPVLELRALTKIKM